MSKAPEDVTNAINVKKTNVANVGISQIFKPIATINGNKDFQHFNPKSSSGFGGFFNLSLKYATR